MSLQHRHRFLLLPRLLRTTLFPYTTLFRSQNGASVSEVGVPAPPFLDAGRLFVNVSSSGRSVLSIDRKSTRLNSSHVEISYAVFCLRKKIFHQATFIVGFNPVSVAVRDFNA